MRSRLIHRRSEKASQSLAELKEGISLQKLSQQQLEEVTTTSHLKTATLDFSTSKEEASAQQEKQSTK